MNNQYLENIIERIKNKDFINSVNLIVDGLPTMEVLLSDMKKSHYSVFSTLMKQIAEYITEDQEGLIACEYFMNEDKLSMETKMKIAIEAKNRILIMKEFVGKCQILNEAMEKIQGE